MIRISNAQGLRRFICLICLVIAPAGWADNELVAKDYLIGVGDLVEIKVHGEDDLTVQARIEERGTVDFPLLGEMRVAGLTAEQVSTRLEDGLRGDYLIEPDVQVIVREYRPFYVHGFVFRPGSYPYRPGLNIRTATTIAGGLTERASEGKIYIVREGDLKHEREKATLETPVYPGDTIIVEEGLF